MDVFLNNKRFILIRDINENDTHLQFRMNYIINEYNNNSLINLNDIIQKSKIERNKKFFNCKY